MADHGCRSSGFHRFCGGPDELLGPLVDMRAGKITRQAAASEIARRYREFVDIFEKARFETHAAVV